MVDKSAIEWAEILCANHLQRNPLHAGISITMRVLHPDWARSLRDQCQDAGVASFQASLHQESGTQSLSTRLEQLVERCRGKFSEEDVIAVFRTWGTSVQRLSVRLIWVA
jgi:protein gp37